MDQVPEHAQHVQLWQVVLQQPINFVLLQEQLIAQHVIQACKLLQTVYIIQAAWQHVQPHQLLLLYVINVLVDIIGMPQHLHLVMEFVLLVVLLILIWNFIHYNQEVLLLSVHKDVNQDIQQYLMPFPELNALQVQVQEDLDHLPPQIAIYYFYHYQWL